MDTINTETLIIGAGPGGLAMAGRLSYAGKNFEIVEQNDKIAGKWLEHYDRLSLHTAKKFSHLPHMEFPEDYPMYVPKQKLWEYFTAYADKFNIQPHFSSSVTNLSKEGDEWVVKCGDDKMFKAKNVVVATGLNNFPKVPKFEGQETFKGKILHASKYKNPKSMVGKKALVVGGGNTGFEIALDMYEHKMDASIAIRSKLVIVPRDIFGKPLQYSSKRLDKLPFNMGEYIGNISRKIIVGDLSKYGLGILSTSPNKMRKVYGKPPTIDLGTVNQIKKGNIRVRPNIKAFHPDGVTFTDGKKEKYDIIVLATGYYGHVSHILKDGTKELNKAGEPTTVIGQESQKGLFFTGFNKFALTGIIEAIMNESKLILKEISK